MAEAAPGGLTGASSRGASGSGSPLPQLPSGYAGSMHAGPAHPGSMENAGVPLGYGYSMEEDAVVVEMLLEAYFMQLDNTWNKLTGLKEYTSDTEDLINLTLDQKRNSLIAVDLMISFGSMMLGAVACVSGLFGMNMPSGLEESHVSFLAVAGGSAALAVLLFFAFTWFSVKTGLITGLEFGARS